MYLKIIIQSHVSTNPSYNKTYTLEGHTSSSIEFLAQKNSLSTFSPQLQQHTKLKRFLRSIERSHSQEREREIEV